MTLGGFADHATAMAGARRGPATPPETGDPALDGAVWELMGASGSVRGVALSPDGKWVAAGHRRISIEYLRRMGDVLR